MPAHKRSSAEFQAFVHNLPELLHIFTGRTGNVNQIYGDHSLIKPAIEFRLILFIMIYGEKRPAAHTGIAVTVFQLLHDLL